jgi:hypothetical protein
MERRHEIEAHDHSVDLISTKEAPRLCRLKKPRHRNLRFVIVPHSSETLSGRYQMDIFYSISFNTANLRCNENKVLPASFNIMPHVNNHTINLMVNIPYQKQYRNVITAIKIIALFFVCCVFECGVLFCVISVFVCCVFL